MRLGMHSIFLAYPDSEMLFALTSKCNGFFTLNTETLQIL